MDENSNNLTASSGSDGLQTTTRRWGAITAWFAGMLSWPAMLFLDPLASRLLYQLEWEIPKSELWMWAFLLAGPAVATIATFYLPFRQQTRVLWLTGPILLWIFVATFAVIYFLVFPDWPTD